MPASSSRVTIRTRSATVPAAYLAILQSSLGIYHLSLAAVPHFRSFSLEPRKHNPLACCNRPRSILDQLSNVIV